MIDWILVLIISVTFIICIGLLTFWLILELEYKRRYPSLPDKNLREEEKISRRLEVGYH